MAYAESMNRSMNTKLLAMALILLGLMLAAVVLTSWLSAERPRTTTVSNPVITTERSVTGGENPEQQTTPDRDGSGANTLLKP